MSYGPFGRMSDEQEELQDMLDDLRKATNAGPEYLQVSDSIPAYVWEDAKAMWWKREYPALKREIIDMLDMEGVRHRYSSLYDALVRVAFENREIRADLLPLLKEHDARFEKGVPADPTQNMSPEDAEKWEEMKEEYGGKFKDAGAKIASIESEDVEEHFKSWATAGSVVLGFVSWAYDVKEETLRELKKGSRSTQLVDDIAYSLESDPKFRHLSRREMYPAIKDFIDQYDRTLIRALENEIKTSSMKVASRSLFKEIVDYRALNNFRSALRKEDPQAAALLKEVMLHFHKELTLDRNTEAALNKLMNAVGRGMRDPGMARNQVAKVADLLGINTLNLF